MQSKNKLRHGILAAVAAVIAITLALSLFAFAVPGSHGATEAHAASSSLYSPFEDVDVTNGEFGESNEDGTLNTPTSWTGAAISDASTDSVISGVISIDGFTDEELEELGLDDVPYAIRTPFGKTAASDKFAGSDVSALLINSDGTNAAYGYDSTSMSLDPNSYYEISAWVKTSDFGEGEGASIKVSGLENDLIIKEIDTVDYYYYTYGATESQTAGNAERYYGWVEYKFYIATSTMSAPSVTISLQLGSSVGYTNDNGETIPNNTVANGWAIFDHVTAKQYSYNMFEKLVAGIDNEKEFTGPFRDRTYMLSDSGNELYYSENDSSFLSFDENGNILFEGDSGYEENEIGSFENGGKGWSSAPQSYGTASAGVGIYSAKADEIGIESDEDIPYSPDGEGGNIFLINSYNGKSFTSTATGFKSGDFKIERRKNYRISVWVKTAGGDSAGIAIAGEDYRGPLDNPSDPVNNGKGQLFVTSTGLGGSEDDTVRYGWSETAFYVKGSAHSDYTVHLELWLGMRASAESSASNGSGIAMFDSIRIEEITSSEYSDNSSTGTAVTFDADPVDSVISNGSFDNIEDITYDKNGNAATPYTPTNWTLMAAGEDATEGMSTHVYDEDYRDYVVSGVVSSDMTSYNYKLPGTPNTYITGAVDARVPSDPLPDNLLMIKADGSTGLPADKEGVAVGYRSLSFSISSTTISRIDVKMRVSDIEGYGVNLALKSGEKEIATIQRIKDTATGDLSLYAGDGYKTYSFYVQAGDSSLSELYLEIWLGMYDDENNTSKLSTGTVYVSEVTVTDLTTTTTDEEGNTVTDNASLAEQRAAFEARVSEYRASFENGFVPYYVCYSTYGSNIGSYNIYDDGYLKTPYNWTNAQVVSDGSSDDSVTYGVYNMKVGADKSVLPSSYTTQGATNSESLVIKNNLPSYSRFTNNVTYTLDGGSYYRVTVLMQVYIPEQGQTSADYKGAYFGIDGTAYMMEDIHSTTNDRGEGVFEEFNLYIRTDGTAPGTNEDGTEEDGTTTTITLAFGMGSSNRSNRTVGTMIINNITLTAIDNVTFSEAQDNIENGGIAFGQHNAIADYTGGETETDEGEDDTTVPDEDLSGNNWYIYISVVLAVVIVIAVIAALVRHMAIKRKVSGTTSPTDKRSYDRSITLLRQHNARNRESDEEITEGYDAFDEDIEDRIENMKALEEAALLAEENRENAESAVSPAPEAEDELTAEPAAEESEETAVEEAEEAPAEAVEEAPAIESEPAEEATEESVSEEVSETATDENASEEEGEYSYSDEIVDFTPSEERRRELEEAKAEKARRKAEKEAARKAEEEARARLEAERREATRRYNKWDDFED